jgi:hypothetical protein
VLPNPKGHIILITAGAVPIILRIGVGLVSVFIIMGIAIKIKKASRIKVRIYWKYICIVINKYGMYLTNKNLLRP